jgi:hypothetical protein
MQAHSVPPGVALLQRTASNRAVGALIQRTRKVCAMSEPCVPEDDLRGEFYRCSLGLLPKLTISQPGDPYEQEADRVAEQMGQIAASLVAQRSYEPTIRHSPKLSTTASRTHGGFSTTTSSTTSIGELIPPGTGRPLDSATRAFFEPRFGVNFGQVRVHTNDAAAQASARLNARAFTLGNGVYFGASAYQPATREGRRLLAHELTHVVQQDFVLQFPLQPPSTDAGTGSEREAETPSGESRVNVARKAPAFMLQRMTSEELMRAGERVRVQGTPTHTAIKNMLHDAPIIEKKVENRQTKQPLTPLPERERYLLSVETTGQQSPVGNGSGLTQQPATAQYRSQVGNLQQLYGNQAVLQMRSDPGALLPPLRPLRLSQVGLLRRKCEYGAKTSSLSADTCEECSNKHLQAKLVIGASNDPLEQEADRVADQVLAAPAHPVVSDAHPRIQRYTGQTTGQTDTAPASVDRVLASPGRALEPALQQDMEQRFGYDFSRVRVHSGVAAEQSARDVNANAYTVGHNIVFGASRFAPGTREGRRLIAHELTHVVQQSGSDCYLARQTAVSPLQAIANDFRAKVDADPTAVSDPRRNVTATGQNFWTAQIMDRVNDLIRADISAPLQDDFIKLVEKITEVEKSEVADLEKKIKQNPAFKGDQKARKLLYTDPDRRTGKELYNEWWLTYRTKKKILPNLAKYLTIPILKKITYYEVEACGYTVAYVADVYRRHGGTGKGERDTKKAFWITLSSTAQRNTCRVTPNTAKGDLVEYGSSLPGTVGKMRDALDDGFVLYTSVLSGFGVGHVANMTNCNTPEERRKSQKVTGLRPEHYILIIGYENDRFLFWDAHPSDSKEFGGGFGFLFFDSSENRLTTAKSNNDLPVDENGEQNNGQHRYQPLKIWTK